MVTDSLTDPASDEHEELVLRLVDDSQNWVAERRAEPVPWSGGQALADGIRPGSRTARPRMVAGA